MKPRHVRIAWNAFAHVPLAGELSAHVDPAAFRSFSEKVKQAVHDSYQIDEDIYVEIPAPGWSTGDLLIYCARKGWLVRRNYVDYWYVDIGFFREIDMEHYSWTDLWLDVVAPQDGRSYRVLDAGEFGNAIANDEVTRDMAAYALRSLEELLDLFHNGNFPTKEIERAEQVAIQLGARTALSDCPPDRL